MPSFAPVQQSVSVSTRSGALAARHIPTIPPSERPQNEKRSAVHEVEHRARDLLDGERALGHRRVAVARMVVTEHAEACAERVELRLPEARRRPERVRQDEQRRVLGAVEAVAELHAFSSA